MAGLSDIITSKVRVEILNLFFENIKEIHHIRGIVRIIKEEINAVRRELSILEKASIVKKEARGNRLYYFLNQEYPLFEDLLSIVSKSTGLGFEIINNKNKIGKLSIVMFSGKFVRRKEKRKDDDVDILIVGEVNLAEMASLIRKEESKRGKEINYTVMSREELEFRKKRRDPFVLGILASSRVMIIGEEESLVS